jgi:hypothetical protein
LYDAENAVTVDRDATEDDIIIEEDEEVARQRARNIEQTRLAEIGTAAQYPSTESNE